MAHLVRPRTWLDRRRARAEADHWIGHGFESRYAWRVAELTSREERRSCARSVRGVLGELDGSKLPGAVPLRRRDLAPHQSLLLALAQRLDDDRPVSAAGMVGVNELLTGSGSCLFTPGEAVDACLRAVLTNLTPR